MMKLTPQMFDMPHQNGWLDRIVETDEGVLVEGWAFQRDANGISFPQVVITSDWEVVKTVEAGNVIREDVALAYPDFVFDQLVGFSIPLAKSSFGLRGVAGIQVFVLSPDGKVSELKKGFKRGLQVELTGRCNLRCPMCPSVIYSDFHKKELTESEIPGLIDFLQDRDFICLDGFGESLLAPSFDLVLHSLPRASEVVFHTNGLLLDKKADKILRNAPPVTWVAVSLDSLDPEKYSRLRAGSSLEKVLANLRAFKQKREALGIAYPVIRLNLTLMKENYTELEDFIRASLEFDRVVECNWLYDVQHLAEGVDIEVAGQVFDYESNKLKHVANETNEHLLAAFALAESLGVQLIFNSYFNENLSDAPDEYGFSGAVKRTVSDCPHLQGDFMLQADGKVQNCVWQTSSLFNWREEGLEKIKQHPRIAEVKAMAIGGQIPHECSGAGCSYVRLRKSDEAHCNAEMIGGYSGERVADKKKIKIKPVATISSEIQ
jgi:MoaA/NifB/PqqE/SkfB family radical SAM enzyme